MAHKIRTTLKRRWIFKRASGNRCLHYAGKTPASWKAAAAAATAAAILCQYIRGQSPITEKKSVFQRTEFGLWFLDDIREEDIIRDPNLQECPLRHRDRRLSEEARAKSVGKRIHVWGFVALPLHRWSFKSVNWAIFVQSEDHKRIIPPKMMNYATFLTRVQFIFSVDRARDHYSVAEAGLDIVRGVYSLVQKGRQTFPLQ